MPARDPTIARPSRTRSKVSNGRTLFVDGDARGPWARRFRDLVELHQDDIGSPDTLSEAQQSLIRRVATLEIELERLEGALSRGKEIDLDAYGRAAGGLRRILESLGIERRARDVTPDLGDYLKARVAAE